MTSPRYGLSTPAFGPSCTEFFYPECWHFDNDSTSKIDDVLTEHGGLLYVHPLAVHLRFFFWTSRGDHSEPFLLFEFLCWTPPSCLKVMGLGWWGWAGWLAHEILVSAKGPLVLGLELKDLRPGLDNFPVVPKPLVHIPHLRNLLHFVNM